MSPAESLPTTGTSRLESPHQTILCLSHLRWNFVYQRPQHLLSRASVRAEVVFFEEPVMVEAAQPELRVELQGSGIQVLTPLLPHGIEDTVAAQRALLDGWLEHHPPGELIVWYYTPTALAFTDHLRPQVTVYDCMDQLSAFQGAPMGIVEQEQKLFERADVVFTGGRSLYEAKRRSHRNVHLFPSSVDQSHFGAARASQADPEDQRGIPHPRIGFFGVIDERLDRDLLRDLAAMEPLWQFVLLGPVVKIRVDELPQAANLHYLGAKQYADLPSYTAHWDVAMLPFAQNESTRFISPTKTPEYLAAGKPVVSTPVQDVVEPYGRLSLAKIASNPEEFRIAIRELLVPPDPGWLPSVDDFLSHMSWDRTFEGMWREVRRFSAQSEDERKKALIV